MNKKGFTLVELLAVVTILAILLLIVAPNVIGLFERNKKEKFVSDAKSLITLAKYKSGLEKYTSIFTIAENGCRIATATGLDFNEIYDPDGNQYNFDECQVMICVINNKETFYVKMYSTKDGATTRKIEGLEAYNFVEEEDLNISSVTK